MQSNKASNKTRKSVTEPGTAASGEPSASAEKTAKPRAAKSSVSKSEPIETTSAKRHRKAAPVSTPEPAVAQSAAKPKAMAAAAGSGTTAAIIIDPVGVEAPQVQSRTAEMSRDRVQELAYQYWLADGKPHGNHFDHWLRAERELSSIR